MTLLVILLVIAAIAVAIIGPTARKRSVINAECRAMEQMAQHHGWSYQRINARWVTILGATPPAAPRQHGRTGTVLNVMSTNMDGAAITYFHLLARNAVSGRGAAGLAWEAATVDKTEHTYCALQLPTKVAPMTVCPPADWTARGFKPQSLAHYCSSGDPQFDQVFMLVSTYPQAAAPLLTPALKHYVASTGIPFTVDESGYLLTWRPGRITDAPQLMAQGQALAHIATHLDTRN